jgi:protein-disulfide isomerase
MSDVGALEPLEETVDHVRGAADAPVILMYGDYECPYTRLAFREIERAEQELGGRVRFAYRHYPLTDIHPHALPAAQASEAASLQGRFWAMHELLFHRQNALEHDDLHRYAVQLELDAERFERDSVADAVLARIRRDVDSGDATGEVHGTPTLFIDGVIHRGRYDLDVLLSALRR